MLSPGEGSKIGSFSMNGNAAFAGIETLGKVIWLALKTSAVSAMNFH
jgi:hypothetical protein